MISGHVVDKGTENSLPYAAILIVETGQGTVSNEDGEFRFKKVPAGKYTLRVQLLGYETQEKKVTVSNDFTVDVHFLMSDESIMTDEVVVSANRNETSRKVAPVVVNVMNAKLFESVNSTDLAKSLNYQSGLRVENNCQNCGFPQVRINGLEGPYSQILINSRPVVSALSGVYGLEQIPVNMIAVSYTHLDVYKRQSLLSLLITPKLVVFLTTCLLLWMNTDSVAASILRS